MVSSGILRRVALVRTNVSEELSASIIKVTGIGELGTTNRACVGCYLRLKFLVHRFLSP
jgi:3-dehydroquinate synthase class II